MLRAAQFPEDGGPLDLLIATDDDFDARESTGRPPQSEEWAGTGRELFAAFRATVGPADEGASVFAAVDATPSLEEVRVAQHA